MAPTRTGSHTPTTTYVCPSDEWPSSGGRVTLGSFGVAHLGDTLCASPLPRLLSEVHGLSVFVADGPGARAVFEGNPHVRGFAPGPGLPLCPRARGSGHVIQRLLQGFELPVGPLPRPEVYLSDEERAWVERERQTWPSGRPICVLSTGALTDAENVARVDWHRVAEVLTGRCTVVQPVLGGPPVPGAVVYRDLPARRYMALVSAADCFVGGTSGGSHAAAALDTSALVVAWRSLLSHLRFPVSGLGFKAWFLYPQHWFLAAEDLAAGCFRDDLLDRSLTAMLRAGRAGRPTALGNHPLNPAGIAIRPAPRLTFSSGHRLRRLPGRYGECGCIAAAFAGPEVTR